MKLRLSIIASIVMLGACTPRQDTSAQPTTPANAGAKPGAGTTAGGTSATPAASGKAANGVQISGDLSTNRSDTGATQAGAAKINSDRPDGTTAAAPGAAAGDAGKINGGRDTAPPPAAGAAPGAAAPPAAGAVAKHAPYAPVPAGYAVTTVQGWATTHKAAHPGYHYVFIPPENAADANMANTLRIAMGKMWNHLSWKVEIDIPEDISGGAGLAFALNAAKIWGTDAETNWGYIANCTAKQNIQVSPAPTGVCNTFGVDDPAPITQFVFNAANGGPYANIQNTPSDYGSFSSAFSLGNIKYIATHHEAIVCGPRISAYRPVHLTAANVDTWYSFTTDEFDGRDNGNINYTTAPTDADQRQTGSLKAGSGDDSTAVASEWWMQLPNGFMYWGIHGEGGQERGKAEFPFAIDPANWKQDNELATGRSCITCHANGIQSAKSDEAVAGKDGWTSQAELATFYATIRGKFQGAMKTLVAGLSDGSDDLNNQLTTGTIEPIAKAIMLIEGAYTGGNDCSFFCNGKYSTRNPLCESLPTRK